MKFICNLILGLTIVSTPLSGYSQKKNITDAAMLMKKYNPMSGLDAGQKIVNDAKVFIDLAAANPETAEDMKMHLYKGMVYYALIEVSAMEAMTGKTPDTTVMRINTEISKASFKKVLNDPKKTKTLDAEEFINTRVDMYFKMGVQAYNSNNFEQSTKLFLGAYSTNKFIDVFCASEICKEAYKFAAISLTYYTDSLIDKKEYDKATQLAKTVLDEMPINIGVYIALININLAKGDLTTSEKYLTKALAIDPKNKQLYYVLGNSYMELKENEKAEDAFVKAIEIDTNYTEAQFQLGAHLVNWAMDIKISADRLNFNDPNYQLLINKSEEILTRALIVLEKYILIDPTNKKVLEILSQIYRKFGNEVKEAEYKKRAQEIK